MNNKVNNIVEAFNKIRSITNGQFTIVGNDVTYQGTDEHYQLMLQQFDSVKPILFYTRDNKWLIMKYLTEHDEYAQLVSMLLGYQGQDAYDNNDEALMNTLHIECCIWQSIKLNAKYVIAKVS